MCAVHWEYNFIQSNYGLSIFFFPFLFLTSVMPFNLLWWISVVKRVICLWKGSFVEHSGADNLIVINPNWLAVEEKEQQALFLVLVDDSSITFVLE